MFKSKTQANFKQIKKIATIFALVFTLLVPAFPLQDAFAVTTIEWRLIGSSTPIISAPINQGDVFGTTYARVHVEDTNLIGGGLTSIDVQLTSTTGDSITLTLDEDGTDNGVFESGRIVLMQGVDRFTTSDTGTITIEDADCEGGCDPNNPDTIVGVPFTQGIDILSDADTATGITLSLVETGDDTKIFTATFGFTTTGSSSGTTLRVDPGDVITYIDNEDFEFNNGFILGGANDNEGAISAVPPGVGTIPVSTHFVTASYNSVSADLEVTDDFAGGRGSGGLIRPGLVVDSPPSTPSSNDGSGSGCSGDCNPPTLGINSKYMRIVERGFSYNGNAVDVEFYYTPYPLITVNVGEENQAVLKVYDDGGVANIEHVGLGFGLGTGQSFDDSRATINLDKTRDGREIVTTDDPENVLDNVKVITEKTNCSDGSKTLCLKITIYHTFREPLDFNMVAIYVWDFNRNAMQNYINHGILIEGESLNPPEEYFGIYKGHLIHLVETGKNTAIDEDGNTWTFDKNWKMDYKPKGKIDDGVTSHGIDRNNARFDTYKKGQELLAQHTLSSILGGESIQNDSLDELKSYYTDHLKRSEDHKLQIDMKNEIIKAEQLFYKLYQIQHNHFD